MTTTRASSLNQARKCPGYHLLTRAGRTMTTTATQAGTWFHADAARHLLGEDPRHDVEGFAGWAAWWDSQDFGEPTEVEAEIDPLVVEGVTITGHLDAAFIDAPESGVIVDWKFTDAEFNTMPPMDQDAQMMVYGIATRRRYNLDQVVVLRPMCKALDLGTPLIIDDTTEPAMLAFLGGIVRPIRDGAPFTTGSHCDRCLGRRACETYLDQRLDVVPYQESADLPTDRMELGRLVNSIGAARAWLDQLEQRIQGAVRDGAEVEWAGRRYVTTESKRESFCETPTVLERLGAVLGPDAALAAAGVTKAGIDRAFLAEGRPKEDAAEFLAEMRAARLLVTGEPSRGFGWRKVRRK